LQFYYKIITLEKINIIISIDARALMSSGLSTRHDSPSSPFSGSKTAKMVDYDFTRKR
jgi:hypothetical protein